MARLPPPKRFETSHVTVRCNNKEYLFDLKRNYRVFVTWLNSLHVMYDVQIHHVLFMSNHMHILLTPQDNNLSQAMSYFLTNLSKYLNYRKNRSDHIFGKRYSPTVVRDSRHFMNVIRYIYQNPVRAGLVDRAEKYPYSSLGCYLGHKNDGIMLTPDIITSNLMEAGFEGLESWKMLVGSPLLDEDVRCLRKILARRSFKFTYRQLQKIAGTGSSLRI